MGSTSSPTIFQYQKPYCKCDNVDSIGAGEVSVRNPVFNVFIHWVILCNSIVQWFQITRIQETRKIEKMDDDSEIIDMEDIIEVLKRTSASKFKNMEKRLFTKSHHLQYMYSSYTPYSSLLNFFRKKNNLVILFIIRFLTK